MSALGKVYEHLGKVRLEKALMRGAQLSPTQFGFRVERSTVHAVNFLLGSVRECREGYVGLVTFDVRNTFGTVSWGHILEVVRRMAGEWRLLRVVGKYLRDRIREWRLMDQTMGVPQRTVLGMLM